MQVHVYWSLKQSQETMCLQARIFIVSLSVIQLDFNRYVETLFMLIDCFSGEDIVCPPHSHSRVETQCYMSQIFLH